jgi:hypothetical protein
MNELVSFVIAGEVHPVDTAHHAPIVAFSFYMIPRPCMYLNQFTSCRALDRSLQERREDAETIAPAAKCCD